MFWDKWKYEIFDKYTIIDKIMMEYKNNIELKEKKAKRLDYFYRISYIIITVNWIVILLKIKDISYIKENTVLDALKIISVVIIMLFIVNTFFKLLSWSFFNYKNVKQIIKIECFKEGCNVFKKKIINNNWEAINWVIIVIIIIELLASILSFCFFHIYSIVHLMTGIIILYMINRKNNQNQLLLFVTFTICIFISSVVSTLSTKVYGSLYGISGIILVLLVVNRLIINLNIYREKIENYREIKINDLKSILENNKINEDKYENILLGTETIIEKYYTLKNKFIFLIKSLLAWSGISVIVTTIKNSNLKDLNNFLDMLKNGKLLDKSITDGIKLIVFIFLLVVFSWLIWRIIIFIFEQIIEPKYMSKEDLFEFRDLLQDIIIMKKGVNIE